MEAKAKEETTRQETDKAREARKHKSGNAAYAKCSFLTSIKQTGKKARWINSIPEELGKRAAEEAKLTTTEVKKLVFEATSQKHQ